MKVKLKNNIPFKIEKNSNNSFFLSKGMFWNIPKIKHNDIWYHCVVKFEENNLIISNLILHHENSSHVKEYLAGEFYKEKTSLLKKNWILYLYNTHPFNYKIYRFKTLIFERRKTIFVFGLAVVFSFMYYIINLYSENWLMNWIGTSLIAQTIIIFLTLSGFINIFTPFTITKEITEKDIIEIAQKTFDKKKEEDQESERKIRDNSF